jgi:hypothetical protein
VPERFVPHNPSIGRGFLTTQTVSPARIHAFGY